MKIEEELKKMSKVIPTFKVSPTITANKEDIKKAKMLQKLINYQFKHNINGFQTKYFFLQKKLAEMYTSEMLYGIKVRWDDMEKTIKTLAGTDYLPPKKESK